MSTIFKGSHWRSRAFSSSHFGGAAPVTGEPGESHWLGSHWKNSQFATAHFRGIVAPLTGEGLHWKNSQFKCTQFATRHFRGVQVAAPASSPSAASSGGGSSVYRVRWLEIPKEKPALVLREDRTALFIALCEAEELL